VIQPQYDVLKTAYRSDGVALAKAALSAAEARALQGTVEDLLSRHEETRPLGDDAVIVRYDGGAYFECLSRKFSKIRELILASNLPRLASTMLGVENVTLWRDEIHYKFGGVPKNATPWHHGAGSFPFVGEDVLTIWVALTDIGLTDAPLRTVTGSHRDATVRFRPPTRDLTLPPIAGYADPPDFDALGERGDVDLVTWLVEPGDAIMFHPFTVHGSYPNQGLRPRMAFVTRWLGADARWAPDEYSVLDQSINEGSLIDGKPSGTYFPQVNVKDLAVL